jgi:hypothetical protein
MGREASSAAVPRTERAGIGLSLAVEPEEERAPFQGVVQLAPLVDRNTGRVGDVGDEAFDSPVEKRDQFLPYMVSLLASRSASHGKWLRS